MNAYLASASLITVLTAVVHTVLGERLIIGPLQESTDLPAVRGSAGFTKRTLRFAWHVTSVLGIGIAGVLFYYASIEELQPDQVAVLTIIAATLFVSFVVSLIGSRGRHPAWILFLAAAILTWLGS